MMTDSKYQQRQKLATELRAHIQGQFNHKYICGKAPFELMAHAGARQEIAGQRVALAKFNVGLDNPRLLSALEKPGILPVLVPWDCPKEPAVYIDRRHVVIEASYPYNVQETDIPLHSVKSSAMPNDGIVLGPNMYGSLITLYLKDMIHLLIGGETGGGKTWAVRSIAAQIANGKNQIILIDGKHGEGLGILNGLPGQVGPLAMEDDDVTNALGWVWNQMNRRYDRIVNNGGIVPEEDKNKNIVVVFDEFQTYTEDNRCPAITKLLRELSRQGRAANIKMMVDTQKPTVAAWGDSATRDQYTTRLGLATQTYTASEAVMSSNTPRLDRLVGRGDSFIKAKVPHGELVERLQMAYMTEAELQAVAGGMPKFEAWPAFDTVALGDDGNGGAGRPVLDFGNEQQACALRAAELGYGRTRLQRLLDAQGCAISGTGRSKRLMEWGRDVFAKMGEIAG